MVAGAAPTPGARLPDVPRQAVVAMVEIVEREQEDGRRREAGPTSPDAGAEPGDEDDARGGAPTSRLARVDERVRNHVRNGRDANGTAGETPATG